MRNHYLHAKQQQQQMQPQPGLLLHAPYTVAALQAQVAQQVYQQVTLTPFTQAEMLAVLAQVTNQINGK